jgi:hypothetical protein
MEDHTYWSGSQWEVTRDGLEAMDTGYLIDGERLGELDWLRHMSGKSWVDIEDFIAAFAVALVVHGKAMHHTPKKFRLDIKNARRSRARALAFDRFLDLHEPAKDGYRMLSAKRLGELVDAFDRGGLRHSD